MKGDLATLKNDSVPLAQRVSAHYYVTRAGIIYQLVDDNREAWHAGDSSLAGVDNVNRFSLGIETEHRIGQDWPAPQLDSLTWLCRLKMSQYMIGTPRVVSHRAIAPDRKVDPSDSPLGPEPAFRLWVQTLVTPARTKLPDHGFVLTSADSLDQVEAKMIAGRYTTLKVITSWGLTSGWTDTTRARAAALGSKTIVRTRIGDPSSGKPFPHVEELPGEIDPWYQYRRSQLVIELTNEGNSDPTIDPAGFAFHMDACVTEIRRRYPLAKIIAGGLLLSDPNVDQWLKSPEYRAVIQRCDYIGIHVYAFVHFDDTGQLAKAEQLYSSFTLPRAMTEYGINDKNTSDPVKGQRYAEFVQSLPPSYEIATYYHYDLIAAPNTNNYFYSLDISGDIAYGKNLRIQ